MKILKKILKININLINSKTKLFCILLAKKWGGKGGIENISYGGGSIAKDHIWELSFRKYLKKLTAEILKGLQKERKINK